METPDEIAARAPRMTPSQAAKIGRMFRYVDPDKPQDEPIWRSGEYCRFSDLARELEELAGVAASDAKVLADLRSLGRCLKRLTERAAADSPDVAARKRRGRISYLEGELARLRAGGEAGDG